MHLQAHAGQGWRALAQVHGMPVYLFPKHPQVSQVDTVTMHDANQLVAVSDADFSTVDALRQAGEAFVHKHARPLFYPSLVVAPGMRTLASLALAAHHS